MGARRRFSTQPTILTFAFAMCFASTAWSAGGKTAQGPLLPIPDRTDQPVDLPTRGSRDLPATVKRTEDDSGNMVFEVTLKGEKPEKVIYLTVPPEMTKSPSPLSKKGLVPKKYTNNDPPEICYFDSSPRLLEIVATEFPAPQLTRLYTITDRGYANRHYGTTPSITFQVITPDLVPLLSSKKLSKQACELHVLFDDSVPNDFFTAPLHRASADPESCEPWVRQKSPEDAQFPPASVESVKDFNPDTSARLPL